MTTPLISIIMPAYNAEPYITEAIQSVINQTHPHWELIIIDDASTDRTPDLALGFTDPRIRVHRVPRIGSPSGVRNHGLQQAQGEYIAFLDADDWYYPNALETLVQALSSRPDWTVVHGFRTHMDAQGNPLPHPMSLRKDAFGDFHLPAGYANSWKNILLGHIICTLPAFLIRHDVVKRIGHFRESLCGPEDYEFIARLFLDNYLGVNCIPAYIYEYRIHTASLTKSPKQIHRLLDSHVQIMSWLFEHPDLPDSARPLKSKAFTEGYHYLARECLLLGHKDLTRTIVQAALQQKHIQPIDWGTRCLQLWIRSYLPESFNHVLIMARQYAESVHYSPA